MLRLARRLAPRFARRAARANPFAARYQCPICGYQGPFLTVSPSSGRRKAAKCPCSDGERRSDVGLVCFLPTTSGTVHRK